MDPFVADRVWVHRIPLRFYSLQMGTRMTVIRLADGGLFVHSPTPLDTATRAAVDRLGPVRFVVAPNRLHHLFVAPWVPAYPDARFFCSPALAAKRADVPWHGVLGEVPDPGWAGEIDQVPFAGSLFMDEIVFFHRPTATLIVTDLLECVTAADGPWERFWGRIAGVYGRPGLTRDQRALVRDRPAARAAAERILAWPFERIVLAHGPLVERDGRAEFARAFAWLVDAPASRFSVSR